MATESRHIIKTRLTQVQFYKVCEFMRNKEEWFKQNTPTFDQAAEYISKEIGFEVSRRTVAVARSSGIISWDSPISLAKAGAKKFRERVNGEVSELNKSVVHLMEYCNQLSAKIADQQKLIYELYRQLGAKYPAGMGPTNPAKVSVVG
jgi:hypothetical protein